MYRDVKTAIKYGRDTLTSDIVVNSLRSKDLELKTEKADGSTFESLYVRGRSQNRQNGGYDSQQSQGSNNNYKKKNKVRSRSKSKTRGKKCYGCGKSGHFIKDCYKRKNEQKDKMADEGNIVEPKEANIVDVYVVTEPISGHSSANFANKSDQIQEWILDSGCTFHMTSKKHWLHDFKSVSNRGSPNGKQCGDLDGMGTCGKFGDGMLKVIKGSLVIFKGFKRNGIYVTQTEIVSQGNCLSSSVEVEATLKWHNRLAHVSEKAYSHQSVGKLEARAQKCVFLGYPDVVKGYRLWAKEVKGFKIITSRDVTFNESNMPCLAEKGSDESTSEDSTRFQVETDSPSDLNQHHNATDSDVDSNEDDQGQPEMEDMTQETHPSDLDNF
ncbi:putative gag-pol polyprotein [Abeliophyllum distichum]|uniref:Gag-pol polyprotein n=1 Tax=Abeliophyllum distichum TaxID=126358 RepID=A0ABD1SXP1_9LAMI